MAMLSALGGLIVVCGFLVFFPHYEHGSSLWRVQLGTFIALIIVGFIISLKAASALEEGIADSRWPAQDIEALRAILESAVLKTLLWACVIAILLTAALVGRHRELIFVGFIALTTTQRLQSSTRRRASTPSPWLDRHDWNPIRSEHWGNR